MTTTLPKTLLISAALLITGRVYAQAPLSPSKNPIKTEVFMTTMQKNKAVIQQLYHQVLNQRNIERLRELISEDYVGGNGRKGVAGFELSIRELLKAFSDAQWKVEEMIAEGDKVMVKQKLQGTHLGPFQQFAPTGKSFTSEGFGMYEFRNGKIISSVVFTDRLSFLQQVEILPAEIRALPGKKVNPAEVLFIDKFSVPAAARPEFNERMALNRSILKNLPGFIEDSVYDHLDENGNLTCIMIARWESQSAVDRAKEAVQAEYQKQGFNLAQFLEKRGITIDQALYQERNESR